MNAYEQLSKLSPNGVASEGSVWKLIEMRILKNENIICIFNCERVF